MSHVEHVGTNIYLEDYLQDTMTLEGKEFIYGNVNNVNIFG